MIDVEMRVLRDGDLSNEEMEKVPTKVGMEDEEKAYHMGLGGFVQISWVCVC
jgi:hypothetical protein